MGAEGSCIREGPDVAQQQTLQPMVMYLDDFADVVQAAQFAEDNELRLQDSSTSLDEDNPSYSDFGFAVVTINGKEVPGGRISELPWGPVPLKPSRHDSWLKVRFYRGDPPKGFDDEDAGGNGLRRPSLGRDWREKSASAPQLPAAPGLHVDNILDGSVSIGEISTNLGAFMAYGAPLFTSLWLGLDKTDKRSIESGATPRPASPGALPDTPRPNPWVSEAVRRSRLPGWPKAKITIFRPAEANKTPRKSAIPTVPAETPRSDAEDMLQPDVSAFMKESTAPEAAATCIDRGSHHLSLDTKVTLVEGLIRCVEESSRVVRSLHDHVQASQRSGSKQAAVERLLAEVASLRQQLKDAAGRAKSQENKVEELKKDIAPLRSELNEAKNDEAAQSDRAAALDAELTALRDEFKQLHAEQDRNQTSFQAEIVKLHEEADLNKREALETQASELQGKMDVLHQQLSAVRSDLANQRNTTDSITQEKHSAEAELTALRNRLAEATESAVRTEAKMKQKDGAQASLREALTEYRQKVEELTNQTRMLQDSAKQADVRSKSEHLRLAEQLESAKSSVREKEVVEVSLQSTLEELRQQVRELHNQSRRSEDSAKDADFRNRSEMLTLKEELESARQATQDEASAAASSFHKERAAHQSVREKHLADLERHEQRHRDLHTELQEARGLHRGDVDRLEAAHRSLNQELHEAKLHAHSEASSLHSRVFELAAKSASNEERLKHKENAEESIALALENHRKKVDELHGHARNMKDEALEVDLRHKTEILRLQEELDVARKTLQEEERAKGAVHSSLENHRAQVEELHSHSRSLQLQAQETEMKHRSEKVKLKEEIENAKRIGREEASTSAAILEKERTAWAAAREVHHGEIDRHKQTHQSLRSELEEANKHSAEESTTSHKRTLEIASLEHHVHRKEMAEVEMEAQVARHMQRIDELHTHTRSLQGDAQAALARHQAEVLLLNEALEDVRSSARDQALDAREHIEKERLALSTARDAHRREVERLEDAERAMARELQQARDFHRGDVERLEQRHQSTLDEHHKACEDYRAELNRLRSHVFEVSTESTKKTETLKQQEAAELAIIAELQEREQRIDELQRHTRTLNDEASNTESRHRAEIHSLTEEVHAARRSALAEAKDAADILEKEREAFKKALDVHKADVERVSDLHRSTVADLQQARSQHREAVDRFEQAQVKASEEFNQVHRSSKDEIANLHGRVRELSLAHASKEEEIRLQEAQEAVLKGEVEEQRSKGEDLHGQLRSFQGDMRDVVDRHALTVQKLEGEVADERRAFQSEEAAHVALQGLLAEHRSKVDELEFRAGTLQEDAADMMLRHQAELHSLQDELANEKSSAAHQEESRGKLSESISEHRQIIDELESHARKLRDEAVATDSRHREKLFRIQEELRTERRAVHSEESAHTALKASLLQHRGMAEEYQSQTRTLLHDAAENDARFRSQLLSVQEELALEKQSLHHEERAHASLMEIVQGQRDMVDEMQAHHRRLQCDAKEMESSHRAALFRLNDELSDERRKLSHAESAHQALQASVDQHRETIDQLHGQHKTLLDNATANDARHVAEIRQVREELTSEAKEALAKDLSEQALQRALDQHREKIDELHEHTRSLTSKSEDAEIRHHMQLNELHEKLAMHKQVAEDKELALSDLHAKLNSRQQHIDELSLESRSLETHKEEQHERNQMLLHQLHDELALQTHATQEKELQLADLQATIGQRELHIDELQVQSRNLETHKQELHERHQQELLRLNDQLDRYRMTTSEQEESGASMHAILVQHRERIDELSSHRRSLEDDAAVAEARHRAEVARLQGECESFVETQQVEEQTAAYLQAALDQHREKIDELHTHARSLKDNADAAENRFLDEINSLRRELSDERQGTQAEVLAEQALQVALVQHRRKVDELHSQAREMKDNELQADTRNRREIVDAQEEAVAAKMSERSEALSARSEMDRQRAVLQMVRDEHQSQYERLEYANKIANNELREARAAHKSEVEMMSVDQSVASSELEEACQTYAVAVDELRSAHSSVAKELDEARVMHDQRIHLLTTTNHGLTQEVEKVRHQHSETFSQLDTLKRIISSEVQEARDSHTQMVAQLNNTNRSLMNELQEARDMHMENVERLERAHRVTLGELGEARNDQMGDMERFTEDRQNLLSEIEQERTKYINHARLQEKLKEHLRCEADEAKAARDKDVKRLEIVRNRLRAELEEHKKKLEDLRSEFKAQTVQERAQMRRDANAIKNPLDTKSDRITLRLFRLILEQSFSLETEDQLMRLFETSTADATDGSLTSEVHKILSLRADLQDVSVKGIYKKLDPKKAGLSGMQFEASLQKHTKLDRESLSHIRFLIDTHSQHEMQKRGLPVKPPRPVAALPSSATSSLSVGATSQVISARGGTRVDSGPPGGGNNGSSGSMPPAATGGTGGTSARGGSQPKTPPPQVRTLSPEKTRGDRKGPDGLITEEEFMRLFTDPRLTNVRRIPSK